MAIGLTTKPVVFRPTHALDVLWGHPLAQGIVGGWMFQEGAGRRVANIISDALPGTFVANDSVTYPTWTVFHRPQYGGRAIQNQTQSYISVGDYALLNPARITVHAWFYRTSTTSGEPGVTKRHLGNNSNNFFLGTGSSPNGMFSFIAYTSAGTLTAESSTNFTTNAWHQVVGTYDGSNARLWVDRINTATTAGSGTLNGNTFPNLVLGSDFQVAGYWNGRIASVVIWNRALASAEITELYTNPHAFLAPPSTRRYFITSMGQAFTKLFTETVTLTDALVKQPGKALNETATLTDTLIRSATKVLSDAMTLSDVLAKLTGKPLSEGVTLTDTLAKQLIFVKNLTETITLTDTLVRSMTKVIGETITLTDVQIKALQRSLTETITLADLLNKQAQKILAEAVTLSDVRNNLVGKVASEVITLTDVLTKLITKVLIETITPSDAIKRDGGKVLSESMILTDTANKAITKLPFTEIITLTDTVLAALVILITSRYIVVSGATAKAAGASAEADKAAGGSAASGGGAGGSGASLKP